MRPTRRKLLHDFDWATEWRQLRKESEAMSNATCDPGLGLLVGRHPHPSHLSLSRRNKCAWCNFTYFAKKKKLLGFIPIQTREATRTHG